MAEIITKIHMRRKINEEKSSSNGTESGNGNVHGSLRRRKDSGHDDGSSCECRAGTTAAVSGAVNTDDLPEVTLTLGSSAASSNDTYQVMVDLEKEVEEKTGGKLKINVVWDGTAGRRWRVGGELHGRKRGYGILGIFSVAGIFPGDRGI